MNDGEDATQAKMEPMNVMCDRPKFWKELTPEEKIERMRFEMKRLIQHAQQFSNLLNQLTDHQHLVDGRPATRLGSNYGYSEMPMMRMESSKDNEDNVYF